MDPDKEHLHQTSRHAPLVSQVPSTTSILREGNNRRCPSLPEIRSSDNVGPAMRRAPRFCRLLGEDVPRRDGALRFAFARHTLETPRYCLTVPSIHPSAAFDRRFSPLHQEHDKARDYWRGFNPGFLARSAGTW